MCRRAIGICDFTNVNVLQGTQTQSAYVIPWMLSSCKTSELSKRSRACQQNTPKARISSETSLEEVKSLQNEHITNQASHNVVLIDLVELCDGKVLLQATDMHVMIDTT